MPPRRIYLLSPKDLPPETIAVAFAKTSRSPEFFQRDRRRTKRREICPLPREVGGGLWSRLGR